MLVTASIFLPFYLTCTALLATVIYLIATKKIIGVINDIPRSRWLLGFCVFGGIVSLVMGNYLGALCSVGILLICIFVLYYRTIIDKRLFRVLIHIICLCSMFNFAFAVLEYYSIVHSLGYRFLSLNIADDPAFRVNASFFNANYYAMIIEFVVICCAYKLLEFRSWQRHFYYLLIIACNLFALYLCGCRTAWPAIIVALPIMLLFSGRIKALLSVIGISGAGVLAMLINPDWFPRNDSFALYFGVRKDIWLTAIEGIKQHPIVGQGPLTYMKIYPGLDGPSTQHAHSVFIDPFLCFGIVGVLIVAVYLGDCLKRIYRMFKSKVNPELSALIIGAIVVVGIHGLLDYTIFWIQTAMLFLIIFSSFSMYDRKD
ncbi:MAG: O-antigen ligase family protein [Erysipelotrichaceae bacterium]